MFMDKLTSSQSRVAFAKIHIEIQPEAKNQTLRAKNQTLMADLEQANTNRPDVIAWGNSLVKMHWFHNGYMMLNSKL